MDCSVELRGAQGGGGRESPVQFGSESPTRLTSGEVNKKGRHELEINRSPRGAESETPLKFHQMVLNLEGMKR